MTQPIEPQAAQPEQTIDTTAQPTAQWVNIYESDTVTASVLLRDGYVTRLLVKTPTTLPFRFAQKVLRHWNTDPRRHFKIASEEWVLTDKEGTQPQYFTTIETTFKDLEWTVIETEPGIVIAVVETEGRVTHVRLDWSPDADLEPEEAGTVCFVDNALFNWNPVPGRRFQLDEEAWTQTEEGENLRFETTVKTTFQTVLELYVDTEEPTNHAYLLHTVMAILTGKLPEYDVDFTSLFGSLQRVADSPFVHVNRTYIDNGEYYVETESGCMTLPPYKVLLPLDKIETVLQAFENNLAAPEATHYDVLALREVYKEIAQRQGIDLASVNLRRSSTTTGPFLPDAYVQGTPEPPDATPDHQTPHEPLDLDTTVDLLVEQLKTFEDADFSATREGVTQQRETVHVPKGWCEPTYQPGELVWHNCSQYQVTGVAPNHSWAFWSYTVLPVDHNKQPDYIKDIQGYLLEHQLGRERPAYCDEQEAAVLHEKSSPSDSEASGVHN